MKKLLLKKNYLLLLFTLIFLGLPVAEVLSQPTWQWAARGGGSDTDGSSSVSEDEKIKDMVIDDLGNIYVTGRIRANANINGTPVTTYGMYDAFLAKFDCFGTLIWARTAGSNQSDEGNGIALSDDGHIYITGRATASPVSTFYIGDTTITEVTSDFFLAKYDTTGNFKWVRIASPGTPNIVSTSYKLSVINSSQIYIVFFAGTSGNLAPGYPVIGQRSYLVKYDFQGDIIFLDTITDNPLPFHSESSLKFDANGNFYFGGTWQNPFTTNGVTYTPQGSAGLLVMKFNNQGILQWVYTQSKQNTTSTVRAMEIDTQGNAYITGTIASQYIFGSDTITNLLNALSFPFLAKINTNGQALWGSNPSTQYPSPGWGVTPDNLGNVYTAIQLSGDGIFGTQNLSSVALSNVVLIKHDSNGLIQWAEMFNSTGGTEDRFTIMKPDNSGNLYLGGSFKNIVTINGNNITSYGGKTDFLLVKHGMASCVVGIDELPGVNYGIHAYPNPSAGKFLIRLERFIPNQNDLVSIYNSLGQLVKEERIEFPGVASVDLTGVPEGIYHVRAFDGEKYVSTKVVVSE